MAETKVEKGKALLRHPSKGEVSRILTFLKPWEILTSPRFFGLENIPDKGPLLFVGNHTLMGVLDVPIMFSELYKKKGIFLRALGDHFHFKVPFWGDFLAKYGVVDGNRANCAKLMKAGESILVFPGGAREVGKRKGEKYKLIWKDRIGFAKLAIQHECTIVPFAAVGAEETLDILIDGSELLRSPLGLLVKLLKLRTDALMPLVKGIGFTPIPRPVRFYFYFARPIDTLKYHGRAENIEACYKLRDKTKTSIEEGISFLLDEQKWDREKDFFSRVLTEMDKILDERR